MISFRGKLVTDGRTDERTNGRTNERQQIYRSNLPRVGGSNKISNNGRLLLQIDEQTDRFHLKQHFFNTTSPAKILITQREVSQLLWAVRCPYLQLIPREFLITVDIISSLVGSSLSPLIILIPTASEGNFPLSCSQIRPTN